MDVYIIWQEKSDKVLKNSLSWEVGIKLEMDCLMLSFHSEVHLVIFLHFSEQVGRGSGFTVI